MPLYFLKMIVLGCFKLDNEGSVKLIFVQAYMHAWHFMMSLCERNEKNKTAFIDYNKSSLLYIL